MGFSINPTKASWNLEISLSSRLNLTQDLLDENDEASIVVRESVKDFPCLGPLASFHTL